MVNSRVVWASKFPTPQSSCASVECAGPSSLSYILSTCNLKDLWNLSYSIIFFFAIDPLRHLQRSLKSMLCFVGCLCCHNRAPTTIKKLVIMIWLISTWLLILVQETEELQKKQLWYQKNQLTMTTEDEEDYLKYCSDAMFRIHVLKLRLSR